jgi:hypothetical protein
MAGIDSRDMQFFVAEINGSRDWRTARGTVSACWGVLCGLQEADPFECQLRGWTVLRCSAHAIESDLRFLQSLGDEQRERERVRKDCSEPTSDPTESVR